MQAYGEDFAKVYNLMWSGFARQVAPRIQEFYEATSVGRANKQLLDLCCGAGHLAVHFLEQGYRVVGIDLSEEMLGHARQNTADYLARGQAEFIQADAADFSLTERFGLVVSTYDSLNHLEDEAELRNCFQSVFAVCEGYFIFDLNTRIGLKRWNGAQVNERDDGTLVISRGHYDGESDKAWITITGFLKTLKGQYCRFDESVFNTVFEMATVRELLLAVGFRKVHFARLQGLATPLSDPEAEGRVFVVAQR